MMFYKPDYCCFINLRKPVNILTLIIIIFYGPQLNSQTKMDSSLFRLSTTLLRKEGKYQNDI